jgi:hypothetical protein
MGFTLSCPSTYLFLGTHNDLAHTTMAIANEPPPAVRPPRHPWLSLVCFVVGLAASSTFHSLPATLLNEDTRTSTRFCKSKKADALARENEALRAAAVSAAAATVAAVAAARKEACSSLFLSPPTTAQTGVKAVAVAGPAAGAAELAARLRGDSTRLAEQRAGHPAAIKCSTAACAPWDDVGLGGRRWWPLPTRPPTGTTISTSTSKLSHQSVQRSLAGWWEYRAPHRHDRHRHDAPPLTPPFTSSVAPGTPSTPSARTGRPSVSTSGCAGNFGSKWPNVEPGHKCDADRPT